jgi:hypothetical protein
MLVGTPWVGRASLENRGPRDIVGVHARIHFSDSSGRKFEIPARWTGPRSVPPTPPNQDGTITIPAQRSRSLDVVVKGEEGGDHFFAFTDESTIYPGCENPDLKLTGESLVTVYLRGDNGFAQTIQFMVQPVPASVREEQGEVSPFSLFALSSSPLTYL